jgi:uncharacterized protein (TIGR02246 family)
MSSYADDVAHIRDTIAAYAQALDDGRTDDVLVTFAPDGVAAFPGMEPLRGHEAIRAAYSRMAPRVPQRHVVSNTVITAYDGQRATASSDLVFYLKQDEAWTPKLVGRYTDQLRVEDGRWVFESRDLVFL